MPPEPSSTDTESPKQVLLEFLNDGREGTLDELSALLDVTRRHVRRLLRTLNETGWTIEERWADGRKLFSLAAEDRAVPVQDIALQERELQALTVAASAARAVLQPTPFDNQLQTAVQKLLRVAGMTLSFEPEWQPEIWHFDTSVSSNVDADIFWAVVRAANACETLRIDYYSASSDHFSSGRRVDPLLIAEQGGSWLMPAYCHEQECVLDFALPGIRAAEATGRYFTRPVGFDPEAHFQDRFHALQGDTLQTVALEVPAAKAPYFRRKRYHPSQTIEPREDGGLLVTFEVTSLKDVAAFVRSWGADVKVLRPPALAARIRSAAQEVLRMYPEEGA
jgi:predicted DNA-binding transcriptional regulator YafY